MITLTVRSAGAFVLAALATAVVTTIAPGLVGGPRAVVIESGSMAPAVDVGDVVLVADAAHRRIRPGAVVTFRDADRRGLVTHRVVAHDGPRLVTRGDANPTPDVVPVAPGRVVGVAVLRVPYVGRPALWISQRRWGWLAAGAACVALATEAVRSPRSGRSARRPRPPVST